MLAHQYRDKLKNDASLAPLVRISGSSLTFSRSKEELTDRISSRLAENEATCDLLVSLFYTAAASYRRSSICAPFPPHMLNASNEKDFAKLKLHLDTVPPVHTLVEHPEKLAALPLATLRLLDWLLYPTYFSVRQMSFEEFEQRTSFSEQAAGATGAVPQYVFELIYPEDPVEADGRCCPSASPPGSRSSSSTVAADDSSQTATSADPTDDEEVSSSIAQDEDALSVQSRYVSSRNKRFAAKIERHGHTSSVSYHASALDNFHSIVHNGLDVNYSKKADQNLYGEGIYLSTDAGVCMSFISYGRNWANSAFGPRVGAMVGCEVAADPLHVTRGIGDAGGSGQNGGMPEQYVLATDNECVRVKYFCNATKKQQHAGLTATER